MAQEVYWWRRKKKKGAQPKPPRNPNKQYKTDPYPVVMRLDCPDKVFFTSDTHFGEDRVLQLSSRPFSCVEEMDRELIQRWNDTVPEDGIVFHLGDFGFKNYPRGHELLRILHGKKYLILGNHDQERMCRGHAEMFEGVSQQMNINVDGQRIFLNHCPLLCFPDETNKTWQLFGHVHSGPLNNRGYDLQRLPFLLPGQYDVGVDNNDFRPVRFEQIRSIINAQRNKLLG